MASKLRTVSGAAVALGVAVGVLWLQWRHDMARAQEGREIVEAYRAPASSVGLGDVVARRHPGSSVQWSGRTESACLDRVRVVASPSPSAAASERYEFLVDVNSHQIAPGNDNGLRAIEALSPSASASR